MAIDQDVLHSDLCELLIILGISDHARPQSSHAVFQEALAVLRKKLAALEFDSGARERIVRILDEEAFRRGDYTYFGTDLAKSTFSASKRVALKTADKILAVLGGEADHHQLTDLAPPIGTSVQPPASSGKALTGKGGDGEADGCAARSPHMVAGRRPLSKLGR